MSFLWPKKREEPKPASASSSMETPSHQPQTPSHPKESNTVGEPNVDFDEMYENEKRDRKFDFVKKRLEIQEHFKDFWSRPRAKEDVDAYYHEGPVEKEDVDAHSKGHSEGTTNPERYRYNEGGNPETNWVKSSTVFDKYIDHPEENLNIVFAQNKDVLIAGNHASFDIAQYPGNPSPAGMSFVHLLGLTRERIYNGVSLPKEKIHLLDDIKSLFAKHWSDRKFREDVLRHQLNRIEERYNTTQNEEGYQLAKQHYEKLQNKIHDLKVGNFAFGLHLFPDHSVCHFHMHIIAMTPEMRQWSTSKHDEKTKDVEEVRGVIQSFDRNTKTFDESEVAKTT